MKKLLILPLALMLTAAMAIPAYAITPSLGVPDMPDVSGIKFEPRIELPDNFWNDWFRDHPLKIELSGINFGF